MSCIWKANGDFYCNENFEVSPSSKNSYSINVFIKSMDKSKIFYEKSFPDITTSAFILDTINDRNFTLQNTPVLLEIQDLTNYKTGLIKPYIEIIVLNSKNERYDIHFASNDAMNILLRTATLNLPTFGPTQIMLNRIKMKI